MSPPHFVHSRFMPHSTHEFPCSAAVINLSAPDAGEGLDLGLTVITPGTLWHLIKRGLVNKNLKNTQDTKY